jgi:flagellin
VSFSSTQASLAASTVLTTGSKTTITDAATGGTFVYTAAAGATVGDLNTAIAAAVTAGTLSSTVTGAVGTGKEVISETGTQGLTISTNDAVLGPMVAAPVANATNSVFISDGTDSGAANTTITTAITAVSATQLGLNGDALTSTTAAQTALTDVSAAITAISAQRGQIGASVNRLNAATSVMSDQVQNLTSASNSIQNADIGKTVANMTQYNILESTGMAALQQSNQAQQAVLKLVQ